MGACVAFLWHMHQPYYKDPLSNCVLLPWVRLHATKGYYDMLSILEEFPQIHQTFNLVPSLIEQLQDYALDGESGAIKEKALELTFKPAAELAPEEKKYLLNNFFMASWDTLVLPHPRYKKLLQKRGLKVVDKEHKRTLDDFSTQDYLDLQVLFNLVWFGYRARKKYPFLRELDKKQKHFTEEEKKELLRIQKEVIKEILPMYRRFLEKGQIDISFSPYYHPILPLLVDTQIARRAMPWVSLPPRFSHPEDARAQIEKASRLYEQLFGKKLRGMWPSEGSVCPELIPVWAEAGIQWVATDEEILLHSLQVKDKGKALYRAYQAEAGGKSTCILFRDRGLSDLIGFTYTKNDPVLASQDMISHLKAIAKYNEKELVPPIISIILDGENPWEHYKEGGEPFLSRLYDQLSREPDLQTVKIGEYLEQYPPEEKITNLHSGSWISHNYDIWIGDPEENEAWNYLGRTRDFLVNYEARHPQTPKEILAAAWEEIYRAEGSDWFWWYGEDFVSSHDEEFDQLFRTHLANVYRMLEQPVPDFVNSPIQGFKAVKVAEKPHGFMSPKLDGICTHFYEWYEAGVFHMKKGTAMHQSETLLEVIHYGFNLSHLLFRLDPSVSDGKKLPPDLRVQIQILRKQNREFLMAFPLIFDGSLKNIELFRVKEDQPLEKIREYDTICANKIVELSIPIADLNFKADEELEFFVQILKNGLQVERYPRVGYISFNIPGKDYDKEMWSA